MKQKTKCISADFNSFLVRLKGRCGISGTEVLGISIPSGTIKSSVGATEYSVTMQISIPSGTIKD